jgi:hypothetical protein
MQNLPNFFDRKHLNDISMKIFDPLSGEDQALKTIRSICKSDGTVCIQKFSRKIRAIINAHPIHRNKHTDSSLNMSLRARARNQRRFLHLMRNFLLGNTYKSVEEHTDWDIVHTKDNFRTYFFKIFGLTFEKVKGDDTPTTPIWEEVNRLCNYYVPRWNRWLNGESFDEPTEETQTTQDNS